MLSQFAAAVAFAGLILAASPAGAQPPREACALSALQSGHLVTLRGVVSSTSHDTVLDLPGCTERVVLTGPWESEAGLEDRTIGVRFQKDPVYLDFEKKLTATDKRGVWKYRVEVTVTGRIDVSSAEGLEKQLLRDRVGFGHPVPFSRYRLVILWMSGVVARPRITK